MSEPECSDQVSIIESVMFNVFRNAYEDHSSSDNSTKSSSWQEPNWQEHSKSEQTNNIIDDDEIQCQRLLRLEYKIVHRPSPDELIAKKILHKKHNETDYSYSDYWTLGIEKQIHHKLFQSNLQHKKNVIIIKHWLTNIETVSYSMSKDLINLISVFSAYIVEKHDKILFDLICCGHYGWQDSKKRKNVHSRNVFDVINYGTKVASSRGFTEGVHEWIIPSTSGNFGMDTYHYFGVVTNINDYMSGRYAYKFKWRGDGVIACAYGSATYYKFPKFYDKVRIVLDCEIWNIQIWIDGEIADDITYYSDGKEVELEHCSHKLIQLSKNKTYFPLIEVGGPDYT